MYAGFIKEKMCREFAINLHKFVEAPQIIFRQGNHREEQFQQVCLFS